jgi:peptidoglycan/xylan/chitin deacetylase (PgdA/CDA1 family)
MASIPLVLIAGLGTATGVGLAAGGFAYASLWPGSRVFGKALIAPNKPGELALTFDDGPNPAATPRLLDILADHKIAATFFVLGGRAQANRELVRRMVTAGHLVGNHSFSHPNLAVSPSARIRQELLKTRDELEQITGVACRFFRPPFGARRPATLAIARELGMIPVLWNAMTNDWKEPSAQKIAAQLSDKIDQITRSGRAANIVLHDGGHAESAANREPSLTAADLLAARYGATHKFVRIDSWIQAG